MSLYDVLFNDAAPLPDNAITAAPLDINARADAGWDYTSAKEDFKDDPYLHFNVFEYILDQLGSSFGYLGAYFRYEIIGDSSAIATI